VGDPVAHRVQLLKISSSVAKQPHLCASFHLKVFGTPIPSKLLPASALPKKPRKPKITHPRPSNDDLVPPPLSKPRALSRAPSEVSSRASPPRQHSIGMRRSLSKTSDSHPHDQFRRSRSRSIDLSGAKDQALLADLLPPPAAKRSIVRAPSGKDLFKGRDVGFLRRTASFVARKHSESQSQCQGVRGGLLGRKTSDPVNSGNVRPGAVISSGCACPQADVSQSRKRKLSSSQSRRSTPLSSPPLPSPDLQT
jgi:hypothetical protein